jgi:hypothetical protein
MSFRQPDERGMHLTDILDELVEEEGITADMVQFEDVNHILTVDGFAPFSTAREMWTCARDAYGWRADQGFSQLNPWRSCPRSKRTQRKLAEDLARARFDHAAALHAVENEHAAREAAVGGID